MKLIGKERLFGRPYAALGDLYYYVQGDLANASVQYQNAMANQLTDPGLSYKIGFIQYTGHDYKSALASFASTEDQSAYPSGSDEIMSGAPGETAPAVENAPAGAASPAVPAAPAVPAGARADCCPGALEPAVCAGKLLRSSGATTSPRKGTSSDCWTGWN